MKKTLLIIILLTIISMLIAEDKISSSEDDIYEHNGLIEFTFQAQFNQQGYRWEVAPFSPSIKMFNSPFYIGSDLVRFSGIEEDDFNKGSLNNYANLSLFLISGLQALSKDDYISTLALIPAVCLLPNALTNLRLTVAPWEDKFFHIYAETNGDFFLVRDKLDLLYSWETGVGFIIGNLWPLSLKISYIKDMNNLSGRKKQECLGFSFGIIIEYIKL